MAAFDLILLAAGAFLASLGATRLVLGWLLHRQILDLPNERSSHVRPTPRGGGLAITPVALALLAGLGLLDFLPVGWMAVLAAAAGLLALSWLDDRKGLPARLRLAAHLGAAALGLAVMPPDALIFQALLPLWADRLVALLAWGWFINLYNFMDGIDGITGIETASIGLGLGILALAQGNDSFLAPGVVLAAVAAGFLVWNWHPAKLFLGDSGSVPLGYLLGWLLLVAAAQGLWLPALVLPLYYLADATITLGRRALRREALWQAHRQHFYQQAAARIGHARVSASVLACNLALAGAALVGLLSGPLEGVALAVLVTALFLALLRRWARPGAMRPMEK